MWQDLCLYFKGIVVHLWFTIPASIFSLDRAFQLIFTSYKRWRTEHTNFLMDLLSNRFVVLLTFVIASFLVFHGAKEEQRNLVINYNARQEHEEVIKTKLEQFRSQLGSLVLEGAEILNVEQLQAYTNKANAWIVECDQWIETNLGMGKRIEFDTNSEPVPDKITSTVVNEQHNALLWDLIKRQERLDEFIRMDVWETAPIK